MKPEDRDTLRPKAGEEPLTITERMEALENVVIQLKGAINDSFANVYVKLDHIHTAIQMAAANTTIVQRAVRRHSERLRAVEADLDKLTSNGDVRGPHSDR